MSFGRNYWLKGLLLGLLFFAPAAGAQVVVTVDGDTAYATISLTDGGGTTYTADVTIIFDSPVALSPQSLNLTAELVDPQAIASRLPLGVSVDPAFPMMITVEPPDFPWLFSSGFDGSLDGGGNLAFQNTYQFEVHTHDLEYTPNSPYRLFKSPIGGNFDDITNDIVSGSMRARGRGPAFSQFLVVSDSRANLVVVLDKLAKLDTAILSAAISDLLRGDLLGLLSQIQALLLIDINGAIATLDELIAEIYAHAGIDIANVWRSQRDVTNDAGNMLTAAETLRFSMIRLQGGASP